MPNHQANAPLSLNVGLSLSISSKFRVRARLWARWHVLMDGTLSADKLEHFIHVLVSSVCKYFHPAMLGTWESWSAVPNVGFFFGADDDIADMSISRSTFALALWVHVLVRGALRQVFQIENKFGFRAEICSLRLHRP
jgi:hypothetical protein